jgi:iron complex outermembrane receptor protein
MESSDEIGVHIKGTLHMRGTSTISSAVRLALVGASLHPFAAAVAAEPSATLEEVTVTAQRREESLQTAPVAVTAISAEMLERRQLSSTTQIVFNVPNLTGNNNVGQSTATTFFLRGVGTTENLGTADTSVGLYLDDVYIARQAVNNFALLDIERIEVLRGPQGTLYGRNSNGGAIKIVTKKPSADPEAAVSATIGNYNRWEARLSGNTPISDKVFIRGNLLAQQADGYIRNVTLNKDVNDTDYIGGRVALRALPSDAVTIDVAADYSRDQTVGGYASDVAGVLRPRTSSLLRVVSGVDNSGDASTFGLSANVAWDINDSMSLTSITGYRKTDQELVLDLSDQPITLYTLFQNQYADQVSQEFQLNGTIGESLRYVAGLYYFDESIDVDMTDATRATAAAAQSRFNKTFTADVTSYAGFGQIEYSLGNLTFIAGARYTRDERTLDVRQVSTVAGPLFNFDSASLTARGAAGQNIALDRTFSKTTPKLGVNWTINDDLFGYVSWTKGFRSGGWTGRALRSDQYVNVNPEDVESWEVGLKATLADGRVRWNNTAFSMDYTNLFNSLQIAGVFLVQTADARIQGLESEFTWRVSPYLDLFANIGYLDPQFTGTKPANLANTLQRSPELQTKLGFSVDYPLGGGSLLVNGDWFHTDEYRISPANLAVTAPTLPVGSTLTGPYELVNASVGYSWKDGKFNVTAACTNCLDEEFSTAGQFIGSYATVYAGLPRFYRLTATVKF